MALANSSSRYRVEDGKTCIDIRLRTPVQIFDSRDPAPFRERELDEDAVLYLLAAAEDIPFKHPLKIVFSFSEIPEQGRLEADTIVTAVHNHFDYETELLRMQLKRTRRRGLVFSLIGFILFAICLIFSQILKSFPDFMMKPVLYEGLLIGSWVAMWRPIDLFLFDWWPVVEKIRYCKKLAGTEVIVDYKVGMTGL